MSSFATAIAKLPDRHLLLKRWLRRRKLTIGYRKKKGHRGLTKGLSQHSSERERQTKMASLKETRVILDDVNNSQNFCLIMQMFQIMQNNQAATAIPVNNAGVLFQMMMLQVVQKMAASMDLFPPVMAPSMRLRTHEPAIGATRQRTDFQMKISTPCLRFPEDCMRIVKRRSLFQFV